jgi:type III pantothenate kinase
VNFDVVGPDGDFLGGVLVPGVEISLAALTARGAKLPNIDLEPPRTVIGKSTVDAIRSGVIYGFAGAIDGILRRLLDELGDETDVIATGGLASAIVPFTVHIDAVDDLLTLTGLRLLWERNR